MPNYTEDHPKGWFFVISLCGAKLWIVKTRAYKIILASLVLIPPILVTVVEQIVWANNPPVGEIAGLPFALLVVFTLPAILVTGAIISLILRLFKKGQTKSYLMAFILPSILHALVFLGNAIKVLVGN